MTPTEIALLGFAAWLILLLLLLATVRTSLVMAGKRASNSFAASGDDLEGFGKRLTRAHANCYENIGLVAVVLLYAMVTNQTYVTDGLATIFLGARIAQTLAHLVSTNRLFVFIRFLFYVVQIAIIVYWLARLAGLL